MNFNTKKLLVTVLTLSIVFSLCGCKNSKNNLTEDGTNNTTNVTPAELDFTESDMFTSGDTQSDDFTNAEQITLNGKTVTIKNAGSYVVSGNIADGQLIIDASNTDKIRILLNGVNINSSNSAAIYVKQADKVFITLASGTTNVLTNSGEFVSDGDTNVDAVVFSKDDLTFKGDGSLNVTTQNGHGIVSKDDLVFISGSYNITASSHAISGKDSIRIQNGTFTADSGKDGMHAENSDDTTLGYIYIADGSFNITADGDGISASNGIQIDTATVNIVTADGAKQSNSSNDFGMKSNYSSSASSDTASTKGIKGTAGLQINGGTFNLDCEDDAIHSNSDIQITNGNFQIKTGDDGIHADSALVISGGNINILQSYEGIEGLTIDINGGTINVTASDDGFNAAGGNDQSGFGGMRPDTFGSSSESYIKITGGKIQINADGDGIDSNGELYVTGGETYVSGPTNSGNGALDYGSTAKITGGILVATGASGMATNFTTAENQGSMLITFTSTTGSLVLKDDSGNTLLTFSPGKNYGSAVISCPDIQSGKTYTVVAGSNTVNVTMSSTIYNAGNSFGGGNPGGNNGGNHGGGMRPGKYF